MCVCVTLDPHPGKHHAAFRDGAHGDFGAVQLQQKLEEGGIGGGGHDGAKEFHIWIHKEKLTHTVRRHVFSLHTHTHTQENPIVLCGPCDLAANTSIRIDLHLNVCCYGNSIGM